MGKRSGYNIYRGYHTFSGIFGPKIYIILIFGPKIYIIGYRVLQEKTSVKESLVLERVEILFIMV